MRGRSFVPAFLWAKSGKRHKTKYVLQTTYLKLRAERTPAAGGSLLLFLSPVLACFLFGSLISFLNKLFKLVLRMNKMFELLLRQQQEQHTRTFHPIASAISLQPPSQRSSLTTSRLELIQPALVRLICNTIVWKCLLFCVVCLVLTFTLGHLLSTLSTRLAKGLHRQRRPHDDQQVAGRGGDARAGQRHHTRCLPPADVPRHADQGGLPQGRRRCS